MAISVEGSKTIKPTKTIIGEIAISSRVKNCGFCDLSSRKTGHSTENGSLLRVLEWKNEHDQAVSAGFCHTPPRGRPGDSHLPPIPTYTYVTEPPLQSLSQHPGVVRAPESHLALVRIRLYMPVERCFLARTCGRVWLLESRLGWNPGCVRWHKLRF